LYEGKVLISYLMTLCQIRKLYRIEWEDKLNTMVVWLALLLHIWEVLCLNLGRDTGYSDRFFLVALFLQAGVGFFTIHNHSYI